MRMLCQLGEENSTETRFQKIVQKYKTGGSLSKKKGHITYGPVRRGNVRLGLYFDIKLKTLGGNNYVTLT